VRPHAGGHEGARSVQKSDGADQRFSESTGAFQALTTPPHIILAGLAAACEARTAALASAFGDPDVLADRRAIAAEGRRDGAT
jgi:hypothetical protein